MNLVVMGIVAGVLGTLTMDSANFLLTRTGVLTRVDVRMIGRLAAGWARGRFRYRDPAEVEPVPAERVIGYLAHYGIGVGLATVYVFGWRLLVGGTASPTWAVAYGVATTAAAYFFLFPSMGLGVFGRRSPAGIKAPLSSLVNHLFYGVGLAAGVALL